ncbi:NADP-dependent oxidoreductase [Cohnella lupini]|uniref:NADPH:quinone reductase-like Zn-dependent oxidoreductase n=1 Tax=Cohnella lupini TaxID=1294267 RepID=A0A3D9IP62_9BACL|nr:NADP-dependent oxidoreductase [Cohnella lupini]RED63299.1 NADPH:quinone reductase-like Zn-dependent oxidoreductase [Cohnella lupini]
MKAVVMVDYGDPTVLQEQELAKPELKETEALVDMYVTTINSGDYLFLSGGFRDIVPLQLPHVLGIEIAGVVREIGEKVTMVKPGDRVIGLTAVGGGYADEVAIDEKALAAIPPMLSFEETVALSGVGLTAWQALFQYGQLKPGHRILIHAGAGAVGHIAVQLAKQHGAYVVATARSDNHEFVRQLGADEVIDYVANDFTRAVSPVDLVLDMVRDGGETERKSYEVLKDGGKLLSLVSPGIGQKPIIRGIEALFVRVAPNGSDWASLIRLVKEQKLKVHIDRIFPFSAEGAAEAHRSSAAGGKKGQMLMAWNR